jgi:oligoendopeptidase F
MAEMTVEKTTGAENVLWDLSVYYQNLDDPAIQRDMDALEKQTDQFVEQYKGRVGSLTPQEMAAALGESEEMAELGAQLGSFIFLNYAEDTNDPKRGAMVQKVTEYNSRLQQKTVFFELEWNNADDGYAEELLADPAVAKHRHYLESLRRYKPYQLSEEAEQILLDKGVTGRNSWTRLFTQIMGALRYDFDGKQLNQSQILAKLYDPDRDVRRRAQESVTAGLKSKAMELTYVFNVLAADKASDDARRGFKSWVSSRNLDNKAPDAVVDALIKAVTSSYDIVAQHYRLKRVLLGLDELTDYDRYAPLPFEVEGEYAWNDAAALVRESYRTFSPRLGDIVDASFDENWIHAALGPNKRSGAFCSGGTPATHPWVLMNYTGKTRDVMTLAHELGHAVHQYLGAKAQGALQMYTPLTTAEMASTFGEMLVFDKLMERESNPQSRLALLAGKIEDSFATIFRQIAMNRFEDGMHTARRTEGELTSERLSEIWYKTQQAMFGDSVTLTDNYKIWWSYIPHFLNTPGYVYAYSFGELLVLALYNIYKTRGAAFVPQYLDVLEAGDSDYPDRILAKVGVDLIDPNFWNEGLAALRRLVQEEEKLARELFPEKFR